MKLTVLLVLATTMQVSAKVNGQATISLHLDKVEISRALNTIERQGVYHFLYNSRLSGIQQKVSIDVSNRDVRDVLAQMFTGTDLTYKILANNLIVVLSSKLAIQDIKVTGKVVDSSGEALPGVSVTIKGTSQGTVTDNAGSFALTAPEKATLVFSYIGYQTQEVPVNSRSVIQITLQNSGRALDQVVVIGYGTQKKRDLTGSIDVVKGAEVADKPSSNPVASLQGMVAGLTIVNSGQAGADPTVRLRGVNSTNNADPLYVVDGILQTNIDYVNPADIETIEVLKDPSSISIYGLQGGNGVIIITTKRAAKGETRINFSSITGVQKVINKIKVTDAAGFQKLYNEELTNTGAPAFDYTNYTANTNWQNILFRSAAETNNTLSISNSGDKSTTYLSLGYLNQQGVERDDQYKKYVGRLNEEIRVTKGITVGGEIAGYFFAQHPPVPGGENGALWAAPIAPVKAGPGLYYSMPSFQRAQVGNLQAVIDEDNGTTLNQGYRGTGDIFAQIKFLKYFTWKSTFYTDLSFNEGRSYTALPYHYIDLGEGGIPTDTSYNNLAHTSVSQNQATYKTFQQDHTLTFEKSFGDHHLTVLAGFSTLYHYSETLSGTRTDTSLNIPNDPNLWYLGIAQASNPGNFTGGAQEDASESIMGRVNYSFASKYLLNATFRRDGSSKFAGSHAWGNFGSIGAGWVMTDEDFMRNVRGLDFLKLKVSYGTVGNGLSAPNYLPYPGLSTSGVGVFGNNLYPSVSANYLPDPKLHWEVVKGADAGFELEAMKRKLSVNVDFYDRKTNGILTQVTLPGTTGNLPYFTNLGTIDNKGVEISATWSDRIGRDFRYSIGGNFSYDKNEMTSIPPEFNFNITNGINLTQSGQSIAFFYGYKQTGIYQTTAELDKTPHIASAQPGDIVYADVNHDGKIDQNDRTYLGTPFPKFNFGGNILVGYKSFDLSIGLQGVAGNKIYAQRRTATFAILNYETNRLAAWTGPGTTNIEPIMDNTRSNNFLFSSYWLEPGDYLRIRNLTIGYTFDVHRMNMGPVKGLRLYLSGQNIATFTKATGYSPEVPISTPTTAGIDDGVYPVPAVYSFGLNATF
ncbi:MAG TPA: TonB-dependent receptor [Dinghuibacter sp.]|uniref:TonB-dependent receptor n=1 Tax=Dinghuibacter sp. TaxID=2024697 RepID=UPI002CDD4A8E|nr:TonB-dependent receptor [Dinghuibacter sp.]HTJ10715.1 TonB-dependent receptor [Dinghuibacter sp.]